MALNSKVDIVAIAPSHVLADIDVHLNGVVGADLEILDSELHRVVALLYLWVHLAGDAVPEHVVLGVLAVVVREVVVVVVVGLAVAVVVPVVVPALVAVPDVLALVVGL